MQIHRRSLEQINDIANAGLDLSTKEIHGELRRAWLRRGLTTHLRLGLCAVVFTGWLLFGGAVLQALEQPGELQELSDLEDSIVMAKENLGDELFAMVDAALSDFPHTGSLCSSWPIDTSASSWTLSKSTFFSLQLATSIGYGTQAPKTAGGKLFSMFYSVVGFCIWVSEILVRLVLACMFLHVIDTGLHRHACVRTYRRRCVHARESKIQTISVGKNDSLSGQQ
jgi:hypothetical protein